MNILLSIGAWQFLLFIIPWYSHVVMKGQRHPLGYRVMLTTHVNRLPAKYLPGGVWQTVARVADLSRHGLSKKKLSVLVLYENSWSNLIAALMSGAAVFVLQGETYWGLVGAGICLVSFFCILIVPFIRHWDMVFSLAIYLQLTLIGCLYWLFATLSFLAYLSAFNLLSPGTNILTSGIYYIFSVLIGFVSIFAPLGIGVVEVTFANIGNLPLSIAEAIIIVAGFRFVVFFSDILNWCLYKLWSYPKPDSVRSR